MTPNSPWLCLKSCCVKLTAEEGALAFVIWPIMHWAIVEGDRSQAAWAFAMNCGGICHTAEASIFVGCGLACAVKHAAKEMRVTAPWKLRIFSPQTLPESRKAAGRNTTARTIPERSLDTITGLKRWRACHHFAAAGACTTLPVITLRGLRQSEA